MKAGIWLLCVVLAAVGLACRSESGGVKAVPDQAERSPEGSDERVTLPPESVQAAAIKSVLVERRTVAQEIRATAAIKPNETRLARVSPRISGKAVEVKGTLGDHVDGDQILAVLDSLDMGEKKSIFLQARTNLDIARRTYQREAGLFHERVSSEKDYLQAKGDFQRSEATYNAAREALRLLGLSDEEIDATAWGRKNERLSSFPLRAPFDGTVVEQHITIGELIGPTDTPYTIADLTTVWVIIDIYEKDLARVGVGGDVQIVVDAYPGESFRGTIAYLSNLVDPTTRAAQARVVIENRDGRLRPGMFATAVITSPNPRVRETLVIPQDAVVQYRGAPSAFVEEQAGTYVLRPLTLGTASGTYVEVLAGLTPGERVVTEGSFTLKSIVLKEDIRDTD